METIAAGERSRGTRRLAVDLAESQEDIREAQRLRYTVFASEMGASLGNLHQGVDIDSFDSYCQHLLVRDLGTGQIAACTRILTDVQAERAGGFYSSTEFRLGNVLRLPGRMMEIGRTCVHPGYRGGAAIAVLWSGLAQFVTANRFDYLIGCASVALEDGGARANAIMANLRRRHFTADHLRVTPHHHIPEVPVDGESATRMPPLLKAYVNLGAKACGEPCWDRDFRVADVFMLLDVRDLAPRYARHFLPRYRGHGIRVAA